MARTLALLMGIGLWLNPWGPAHGLVGEGAIRTLEAQGARVALDRMGQVRFIGTPANHPLALGADNASAEKAANAALERYGVYLGLQDPRQMRLLKETARADGGQSLRFRQELNGLPVFGGELIVNLDGTNRMLSLSGEVARKGTVPTHPQVSAEEASRVALEAVAKWHRVSVHALKPSPPELSVYVPALVKPGEGPTRLVWQLEVASVALAPIRELLLVDALRGSVVLHFNQADTARIRRTHTAHNTDALPGTLLCDESKPNCTGGQDPDADAAHRGAGETYDFYATRHGRDSFDGAGATLVSTVHWDDGWSCPNAFWDGAQMVYCEGFPAADDVVAHELTHAVTEHSSNLFYFYQSGAINESFSDLWGEFVDQTNGRGTDTPEVRWLIGEDVPGMGAIRNMADPTQDLDGDGYADPDRMTSPHYWIESSDSGGVHINSGVNNKAVFLMTDGDHFNGKEVEGIGMEKVAKIYYEVQTNLLTSGSDYFDLYHALQQACANLIGTASITQHDCTQVKAALDAVEMNQEPVPGFHPEASSSCPVGATKNVRFSADMEGDGKFVFANLKGSPTVWSYQSVYATSGVRSLSGDDTPELADGVAAMNASVIIPANAFLHFRHAFSFEYDDYHFYDGGRLEYSTDGGTSWKDAGPLVVDGKAYGGRITAVSGNALAGLDGFVGDSHGYVSTRLSLANLAGQSARFRWRLATDEHVSTGGWVVDDVSIYSCVNTVSPPTADAGPDQSVTEGALVVLSGSGTDSDGVIVSYTWTRVSGPAVALSGAGTHRASFIAPAVTTPTQLIMQLTVRDDDNQSASDQVTITINPATAGAEPNEGGGSSGGGGATEWLTLLTAALLARRRRAASTPLLR